jgi:hypothetical protein
MVLNWTIFGLAVFGGALGELLKWWQLRESPNLPAYKSSLLYWILTVLMILAGGVVGVVYGIDPNQPVLAINVGISAPLIIKALSASAPPSPATRSLQPDPSILNFLAGR